jgi:hypothetical protein
MTEEEWQQETRHPQRMVFSLRKSRFTRTKAGRRKLRLYATGCCRLVWDLLTDPSSRQAVEVAERFAEGQASKKELAVSHARARRRTGGTLTSDAPDVRERTAASLAAEAGAASALDAAFGMTVYAVTLAGYRIGQRDGLEILCHLLRCVIGNPCRLPTLHPSWRTPTITSLAEATYRERALPSGELDPTRLAILADALEDVGCPDTALLDHLRSPGPHVRGCWAVDLMLGKS